MRNDRDIETTDKTPAADRETRSDQPTREPDEEEVREIRTGDSAHAAEGNDE